LLRRPDEEEFMMPGGSGPGAVKSGGTWKVGVASFCRLLALENRSKTSSLPAACRTAT
jgi:hypothetical protein